MTDPKQNVSSEAAADAKRRAFGAKMTDVLNFGALNLAMAIGYRTGLFDVMDALPSPQPTATIAARAGLSPRYVREWMAVMACGQIVEMTLDENGQELFSLPKEHGDWLARRAGNSNVGVYTQEIPLLTATAMEAVVGAFSTGQGIGYERYPRFQEFMAQLADAKHRQALVSQFLPSVDQGRMLARLNAGINVCDVGCGQGVAAMLMAEAFPNSRITGIDIGHDVIAHATGQARSQGLANLQFFCADAAALDRDARFAAQFDYVTAFDAIHDQTRPLAALRGVWAILKPQGLFSMVDIAASSRLALNAAHPMGPFLYTVSLMHCLPVGLADGGEGLGMMWGREKAVAMLASAGFADIQVIEIQEDSFNLHFFCRKTALP
jgi:ubiquinone/menaquinone biosynthesis C-methylase UbiE